MTKATTSAFYTSILGVAMMTTNLTSFAQEHVTALGENIQLKNAPLPNISTIQSTLSLPFFDDFSQPGPYPDASKWSNNKVYINDHFAVMPLSKGVATFDALNEAGVPYNEQYNQTSVIADSLTSQYFNFSQLSPNDSIYLSFYVQPQGKGGIPQNGDSLMLYFQNNEGKWIKVWGERGSHLDGFLEGNATKRFQLVMQKIDDPQFFHSNFRFTWVNKATIRYDNSHWHLDYVYLNKNRSYTDSLYNDKTLTLPANRGNNILESYSAMPYSHFKLLNNVPLAANFFIHPNTLDTDVNLDVNFRNRIGNTTFYTGTASFHPTYLTPTMMSNVLLDNTSTFNSAISNDTFTLYTDFYLENNIDSRPNNDTVTIAQHFKNYFAYDDGSAEKAYFLTQYPSAPAYTAIEFELLKADTLQGAYMYLPRQVPSGALKEFYIQVYKSLGTNGTIGDLVYQSEGMYPNYSNFINGMSLYAFEEPVVLDPGTYYFTIMQPAGAYADSLYIGLDVHHKSEQKRYINYNGSWEPSQIPGSLLVRPIVGAQRPLGIEHKSALSFNIYPNPVENNLSISINGKINSTFAVEIVDILGTTRIRQTISSTDSLIDVKSLMPGTYAIIITDAQGNRSVKPFIKL